MSYNDTSRVLSDRKLEQLERILKQAVQMQYAEVTLVIEKGSLRRVRGPAPVVKLRD